MIITFRTTWHTDDGPAPAEVEFEFTTTRPRAEDIHIQRAWWVESDGRTVPFSDAEMMRILAWSHVMRERCLDVAADRVIGW